ncbi:hypothetical protein [Couchioplanes azureus]|uniref:hypothetical protein n=1 Tax=Couchioplanes caeruleus TaxID=56438 RepID=UPI00167106BA|nr:hypothetical protein [Couchioplanes caeruleus]GGQ44584.1 hypothetical protein GCM10010166_11420 [Couchioplanes caeruleus subsp. azureus]
MTTALPDLLIPVLQDVSATYPLRVTCEAVKSRRKRESIVRIVAADAVTVEISVPNGENSARALADVADRIADELVEALPAAGYPAVWPECPLHPGSHPLEARTAGHEAMWTCPSADAGIAAIGSLT